MTFNVLSIRETHTYVGTWRDLDRWNEIGIATEIGQETLPLSEEAQDDYCEPVSHRLYLKVALDQPEPKERIEQAIHDIYTQHGCSHEYDCCGCRSFSCDEIAHEGGPIWSAVVSSSRNF